MPLTRITLYAQDDEGIDGEFVVEADDRADAEGDMAVLKKTLGLKPRGYVPNIGSAAESPESPTAEGAVRCDCGEKMVLKTGESKGMPWKGWFCTCVGCKRPPFKCEPVWRDTEDEAEEIPFE